MSRVYLAAVGDVHDPITWSGTPYHFLQVAKTDGLINEGLALRADGPEWKRQRLLWNAWRLITGRGKGGYQYSIPFLEQLWAKAKLRVKDGVIINCYQLYPPSMVNDPMYRKCYYIDMTLKQLFVDYQLDATIGKSIAADALAREKSGYQAAQMVVCHSQWAASSVVNDYGIDASKVKAIVPGANIDRDALETWQTKSTIRLRQPGEPLKLLFVGKYWDRKGLDRLLEALLVVNRETDRVQLQVMGCERASLPAHLQNVPHVEWLGFINKKSEMQRFLDTVASADVGCLLSRAEAGGMVQREYHALGLIVLGTAVGGAPEHMFADAGKAFAADASAEQIAGWLIQLASDHGYYSQLRRSAWERREQATWLATGRQWRTILPEQYIG
jgi:glycosyltransferase involved in cell wall biosynthesis